MAHSEDQFDKYPDACIDREQAGSVIDYLIDQHETAIDILRADLEEGGLSSRDALAAQWLIDKISHDTKVLLGYAQGDGPQPPDELLA